MWYNVREGMKRDQRRFKVAVTGKLRCSSRYGILAGFVGKHGNEYDWDLQLLPMDFTLTPSSVAALARDGIDGLFVFDIDNNETLDALARAPFKTVALYAPTPDPTEPRGNVSFHDNTAAGNETGAAGLRYLKTCGRFSHFAFVPNAAPATWSKYREAGFVREAEKLNLPCSVFDGNTDDSHELGKWIKSLPLPAAIMAAYDRVAMQVLVACRAVGMRVPGQVCVLGVDNDTVLCEHATPPLSSIRENSEAVGASIAKTLQWLMTHPKAKPVYSRHPGGVTNVVERDSTRPPVPAAMLIRNALEFIAKNAAKGITPDDVARSLGVSRRLLFLRFKELHDRTVTEEIRKRQLEAVCHKLKTTRLSLGTIAQSCGFASRRPLERLFRAELGCSMREWRTA